MNNAARRTPVLFVGHGNPMNAIEASSWSDGWSAIGAAVPRPRAILAISAHWETRITCVTAMARPRTIHDFGGFPRELFEQQYPAPGDPALADRVRGLVTSTHVEADHEWGIDHGTWSVLARMVPSADIPVVQLSLGAGLSGESRRQIGAEIAPLREEGVLILASGNIVHNLRTLKWQGGPPYDWASAFDERVAAALTVGDEQTVVEWEQGGESARLSVPTDEHYTPLLYAMGAAHAGEPVSFPLIGFDLGSLSMRCVRWG